MLTTENKHEPYEQKLKHKADFRIKYNFRSKENGGRTHLPFQGLRCDFSYSDEPGHKAYIIWPEFEDKHGDIILEKNQPIPKVGTALMWVIIPEMREIHKSMINVGQKCFFWEGKITADCEVIEVLDLLINPTK